MRGQLSSWLDPRRSLRARIGLAFACAALLVASAAGIYFDRLLPLAGLGLGLAAVGLWVAGRVAGSMEEMERALIERAVELENVVETMAEGMTLIDNRGFFVRMNAAAEEIFGVPRDQLVGRHVSDVPWTREFRPGAASEEMPFTRLERGERRIRGLEYDIVRADGTRVPVTLNAARLQDPRGVFAGVVSTFVDISERRRAEEAARRLEQITAATVATALDAIITVDHQGNVLEFNPAAEACFRYSRSQIVGKPLVELLIPPRLRSRHREGFERYISTRDRTILGRRLEMPAVRADGVEIEIELAITQMPGHEPPVFTAFARDVTEKARAEKLAREAQERLDRALDASNIALFEVDLNTSRVYLSESWSVMLGKPRAPTETTIAALLELCHPDERQLLWDTAMKSLKGEQSYEVEHRVRTASGDWIWVLSRARVVERDASGRAVRLSGTDVDITERKLAAQRIHYFATRDTLTDLANRATFTDRLELALESVSGDSGRLAVLCIGIDRFTTINNSLGHRAGDRVLKGFA